MQLATKRCKLKLQFARKKTTCKNKTADEKLLKKLEVVKKNASKSCKKTCNYELSKKLQVQVVKKNATEKLPTFSCKYFLQGFFASATCKKKCNFFLQVSTCKKKLPIFFLQVSTWKRKLPTFSCKSRLAKKVAHFFFQVSTCKEKSCNFFGNWQVENFCYAKRPELGYRKCPSEDGKSSYCIL